MLAKYGHANQAYELAINEDMPSWGYWMKQGLTTLSENGRYLIHRKINPSTIYLWVTSVPGCIIYWQVLIMMNSILDSNTFYPTALCQRFGLGGC